MTDTGSVTGPSAEPASPAPDAAAGWHRTRAGYPADATIPGLFAAQAARNPDATALVFGGEPVSYAELDRRGNALAWLLRRRGVGTDMPVGVAIERGTDLFVALLAVLKAGGAYLPIQIGTPAPRVAAMIGAAGARLVLVTAGSAAAIPRLPGVAEVRADTVPAPAGGVANGYHGAPAMTAARFVPDPLGGRPGARLYRTGDVGRWRRSGRIELAGRADRQIKIRGYRIESGEVEAALRGHDDIAQAVVSLRGRGHDVRLVGYLVTRSGTGRPPAGLREHLREVLPGYMVPATFVVLPALPLTGSGKVDYRALPEPDWGAAGGQVAVAPRTPTESKLAVIIAELLALPEPVGRRDNFFALGGHSLTATQLMARIRAVFGVDLPIRTLFSDPTVAGLAAALADAGGGAAGLPGPAGGPARAEPGGAQAGDLLQTLAPADGR